MRFNKKQQKILEEIKSKMINNDRLLICENDEIFDEIVEDVKKEFKVVNVDWEENYGFGEKAQNIQYIIAVMKKDNYRCFLVEDEMGFYCKRCFQKKRS